MLKITNTEVYGWKAAIRGMRNPMNSWDKSDSYICDNYDWCDECEAGRNDDDELCNKYRDIGDNDLSLMKKLANAGPDHGKVLRYLTVQLDISAPLYWWKEFKTYRKDRRFMDDGDDFLDPEELEMFIETNSCSTMHKIHTKEFELDDFSHEHLTYDKMICKNVYSPLVILEETIHTLNDCRTLYLETKNKKYWYSMIQLLPSSYNQLRTVQLNYQVLRRMYHARKNHKLDEWRDFCAWIKTLPYSELITGED